MTTYDDHLLLCAATESNTYLYTLTFNGVLEELAELNRSFLGMKVFENVLYCLVVDETASIYYYDPETGLPIPDESLEYSYAEITNSFSETTSVFNNTYSGLDYVESGENTYFTTTVSAEIEGIEKYCVAYINTTTLEVVQLIPIVHTNIIDIKYLVPFGGLVGLTSNEDNYLPLSFYFITANDEATQDNEERLIYKLAYIEHDDKFAMTWNKDDGFTYVLTLRIYGSGED